jgi:hypothetical protein
MTGRAPFLGQSPFDIPYQPFTLFPVGLHPLLINQLIDLRVTVTGVVAFGATPVILVELLVRIVDPGLRYTKTDSNTRRRRSRSATNTADVANETLAEPVLAHDLRIPLGRVDRLEFCIDIDLP